MENSAHSLPGANTIAATMWTRGIPFDIALKELNTQGIKITDKQLFIFYHRLDCNWHSAVYEEGIKLFPIRQYKGVIH